MSIDDSFGVESPGVEKASAPIVVGGDGLGAVQPWSGNVIGEHRAAEAALQVLIGLDGFVHTDEEFVRGQAEVDLVIAVVQVVAVGGWGMVRLRPEREIVQE